MMVNRHGTEWAIIKRRNLVEIEKHRQELETLLVGADRAHQLRGMIHALREQIEFVEPSEDPAPKDINYG